jgi:predicted ATPase
LGHPQRLIVDDLLTEFVDAIVNAFEELVAGFFSNQAQRGAFGDHVVEPRFSDFAKIPVVGTNEIE